jgi:hypothetical protein
MSAILQDLFDDLQLRGGAIRPEGMLNWRAVPP